VQEQLKAHHIEESTRPLNSPVFVKKKKRVTFLSVSNLVILLQATELQFPKALENLLGLGYL
ncbi:hypothetical protein ACQP3C_27030, partial [Escherichia coli]